MKFLSELHEDVDVLFEGVEQGEKQYFIEGIFMQSEAKNRNGRIYPKAVIEKEVERYNECFVKTKRAMGELEHPETSKVNMERVSHLITDLRMEGTDVIGKAKILKSMPMGKIVKNLIDEGVKFGVSSRGYGSVSESRGVKIVGKDFHLAAVDIVSDPSAHQAFVQGIMEGKEFYLHEGIICERQMEEIQKTIRNTSKHEISEGALLRLFENFMKNLGK